MHSCLFVLTALAAGAIAQTTTSAPSADDAQTTITALVGAASSGLVGSIINVDDCKTTMQFICTDEGACGIAANIPVTFTQGPTNYGFAYSTMTAGGSSLLSETCDLEGPVGSATQAVCTVVLSVSAGSESTATTTSTTFSGDLIKYAAVPVTAGADKLSDASACPTGGATGMSGIREVYKVVVPVGAAALAAFI